MTFLFEKQLLQENKIHIIWIVTWDLRQVSSLPIERICKENGVMAIKHYKDIQHDLEEWTFDEDVSSIDWVCLYW